MKCAWSTSRECLPRRSVVSIPTMLYILNPLTMDTPSERQGRHPCGRRRLGGSVLRRSNFYGPARYLRRYLRALRQHLIASSSVRRSPGAAWRGSTGTRSKPYVEQERGRRSWLATSRGKCAGSCVAGQWFKPRRRRHARGNLARACGATTRRRATNLDLLSPSTPARKKYHRV